MAPHLQSATSSDAGSSTRQHNTEPNVHPNLNDIGKIIDDKMSFEAVAAAVKALSVGEKYHLLKDHFVPPTHYEFPSRFLHQCHASSHDTSGTFPGWSTALHWTRHSANTVH